MANICDICSWAQLKINPHTASVSEYWASDGEHSHIIFCRLELEYICVYYSWNVATFSSVSFNICMIYYETIDVRRCWKAPMCKNIRCQVGRSVTWTLRSDSHVLCWINKFHGLHCFYAFLTIERV